MAKAFPLFTQAVDGDIAQNAPIMLHIRLSELLHFAQHIHDPDRVAELHAMRIAAKRLRYTMEIFQPYIEPSQIRKTFDAKLAETKHIQDLIGEIHDRDVRVPLIYGFLTKREHKKPELRAGLNRLINEECRDRDRLFAELISHWDLNKSEYIKAMVGLISEIALFNPKAIPAVELEHTPLESNGKSSARRTRKTANA
jgi:hypothetical protein